MKEPSHVNKWPTYQNVPIVSVQFHSKFSTNSLIFHAAYQRDEDVLTQFIRIHLPREDGGTDSYAHFQKDEGDPIPYEAGGVIHLLSTNAGRAVAVWANGPAECAISGDITIEELQQIIDSIY